MTFDKIKSLLCEGFEIDEADISPDTRFVEDLGFDELDICDLVMDIEDNFEMELPDEALEEISTIADLVKYIDENN